MCENNIYYDINDTLSHNCLYNFVIGNRAAGKTYGWKKKAILDYIRYKKKFLYLRRFSSDLDKIREFFKDLVLNGEFKNYVFKVEGNPKTGGQFFINDEVCGYFLPLTVASGKRGTNPYPDVYNLCYDEFMIYDYPVHRYLKNEVSLFLDFYNTIDRFQDRVKVFFFANSESMINPYFLEFNLRLQKGQQIYKEDGILLQNYRNDEMVKKQKSSVSGKIMMKTGYGKMAIENQFIKDNTDFHSKKSRFARYQFSFKYNNQIYGVWVSYKEGKTWVSRDYDKTRNMCYALTTTDMTPNMQVLARLKTSNIFKRFIDDFRNGVVYYEDLYIKNVVYDVMKLQL